MTRCLSIGLVFLTMVWGPATSVAAAEGPARLLPETLMLYVEARSPEQMLAIADGWLTGLGGRGLNPLDGALDELAQDLGMDGPKLRHQIGAMKSLTVAVTGIDPELEEPVVVWVADMGAARTLRDALERQLKSLGKDPVATVQAVPIYSDGGDFACVVGNHVISGRHRLQAVKDVVERMKGANPPGLDRSTRFLNATAALDRTSPVIAWLDVRSVHGYLREHEKENDDLVVVDAMLDLATIDSAAAELITKDGGTLVRVVVNFSGENRAYGAVYTPPVPRTVHRFFSADYAAVNTGRLADGRLQWIRIRDLVARVQRVVEEGDFDAMARELEDTLKIRIDVELSNVTEYGVGVRAGEAGWEKGPELLFVFQVVDVNRARELMRRVEEAAREGNENLTVSEKEVEGEKVRFLTGADADRDYAWAVAGGHLLLGTNAAAVGDALRTHRQHRKCLFDEPGARKVLARLHPVNSKLLLVNPVGFLPGLPRNPNAPPPAMAGVSTLESPRRIEIRADGTDVGALLRRWLGLMSLK